MKGSKSGYKLRFLSPLLSPFQTQGPTGPIAITAFASILTATERTNQPPPKHAHSVNSFKSLKKTVLARAKPLCVWAHVHWAKNPPLREPCPAVFTRATKEEEEEEEEIQAEVEARSC